MVIVGKGRSTMFVAPNPLPIRKNEDDAFVNGSAVQSKSFNKPTL